MASKQKVMTKRTERNKHNFEKRQGYDIRMLNKKKVNRFTARQKQKRNTGKQFTKDCSCINFCWYWW